MPSAFQHFFNKLLLGLTVKQVTTCINLASLTVFSYDWILNLPLEINLVWKSRRSLIKYLYFITRYLAFGDVTILIYVQVAFSLSAKKCTASFAAFGWMFTTGLTLGELLLVMRTWAVWGRDRKLGIALFIFYTGLAAPMFVNMGLFLKSLSFIDALPGISGCVVTRSSNRLYVFWVLLMVLDIGVCSLMIMKGYRSYVSGANTQLVKVVYGEGILYYVYLVALSMINVILILRLPPEYLALLSSPMRSLHSILTCRVVLHTRQQAKISTVVLGGSSSEETRYSGGPVETLRFGEASDELEELEED